MAKNILSKRFRGYYPVVVDVETGGLDPQKSALLEIAATVVDCDTDGVISPGETKHYHINPFPGSKIDEESLKINKINPDHPFRFAVDEKEALTNIFSFLRDIQKKFDCIRCVLVGHNAWFDLHFLNAAIARCKLKNNPFHPFTSFDTATLSALVYGHTVLAQAMQRAKIDFDDNEQHSAKYDSQVTAQLFCKIVNQFSIADIAV